MAFTLIGILFSCSNESDPQIEKESFSRIYDKSEYNASYFPIDIVQTVDGGYLILGGRKLVNTNFSGIYILKTDELGQMVSETEIDETYVNAIGPLLEASGKFYFFCMSAIGLQSQLISISSEGEISEPIPLGSSYPSASAMDGNNFILQSYDNFNKLSVLSVITPNGDLVKSKGFSIGAGDAVEEPIINHFLRTGKQFPFLAGRTSSGQYYFNGFYNYTFSLVFTDLNQDDPTGVVQGQQDDGGLSQVIPLQGSKFAISRFNFGDNFYEPNATINTSGVSSSIDLGGYSVLELVPDASVKILLSTINGKSVLLYGGDTRTKQIGILGYEESSGKLVGSRYLGFSNPYELASIKETSDGGLVVCGTTYLAGRFPRICLFKLSPEEVEKTFN
jgi:hypothetical protein